MVDYVNLQGVANRLIDKNGRTIMLQRMPRRAKDGDKPWRADPEANIFPEAETTVRGVFVPLGGGGLGTMFNFDELSPRPEKVVIIQPGDGEDDLTAYDQICDKDGQLWKVRKWQTLDPADLIMMYFAAVSR